MSAADTVDGSPNKRRLPSFECKPSVRGLSSNPRTLYSTMVSCITETRWLVEPKLGQIPQEEHLGWKFAIARE